MVSSLQEFKDLLVKIAALMKGLYLTSTLRAPRGVTRVAGAKA